MTDTILIAPNAFKGSLTASEVASSIKKGIHQSTLDLDVVECPVADGGDGTLEVLVENTGGETITVDVHDPLNRPIEAKYGLLGDGSTAVVEMARASGLALLESQERQPLETTTRGTGELIRDAIDKGCTEIIVGIGGSATVDGGTGMARELGYQFLNEQGEEVPLGGGSVDQIRRIEKGPYAEKLEEVDILCACDVTNPLTGERGAANVYAPQKGASEEEVQVLERNLQHLEQLLAGELEEDVSRLEGGGAAGGLGAGLYAFCGATMKPGVDVVFSHLGLDEAVKNAQLVISGEGELDRSSLEGKATVEVARLAQAHNVPCILLCGSVKLRDAEDLQRARNAGITSWFSTRSDTLSIKECMTQAEALLQHTTRRVCDTISLHTS